jgi:hypothetical protein
MHKPKRKVLLGVGISLDGYIARPDGAVDFLFMPPDFSMAEFVASVDVNIIGRKTLGEMPCGQAPSSIRRQPITSFRAPSRQARAMASRSSMSRLSRWLSGSVSSPASASG